MSLTIAPEDPETPDLAELIRTHLFVMSDQSPEESVHALDIAGLQAPSVTVWSVRDGPDLLGCGALKQIGPDHGEIKSMHTAAAHRGRGVARRLLEHLLDEARRRGYARLSLETGSMDSFRPARALYAGYGFTACPPFAEYGEDPNSVFMTLRLA